MRKKTVILASSIALLLPTIQAKAVQTTSSLNNLSPVKQSEPNQNNDSQNNRNPTSDNQDKNTNLLEENLKNAQIKKDNLQKQLSDIQQFIDTTEKSIMDTQSKLDTLNTQIADTQTKITNLTKSLDENKKEIQKKTSELNDQKIKLGQTISFLYENKNFGFFQFFFQTKNLSELFTINEFINIVADENNKLYKNIQSEEKFLTMYKEKLENNKKDLESSNIKLLDLKKQQEAQQAQQNLVLNQHKEQEAETIKQINEEENVSNEMMIEINKSLQNLSPNSGSKDIPLDPSQTLSSPMKPGTYTITSLFGKRPQPTLGASTFHDGIDFGASLGTPIYSCGTGTVLFSGPSQGFGNWIVIQNDNGLFSIYGHMESNSLYVKVGQRVIQGQQIAEVGNAGISTGSHLHLGIATKFDGSSFTYIDPLTVLK